MKKTSKLEKSIFKKQNEHHILEMQAAAKIYYSSTPFYSNIVYIFGIVICLISVFSPEKWYFNLLIVILNLTLLLIDYIIVKERNKAAKLREYIDAYLYGLKCDISEEEVNELTLVQKKKNPKLIEIYCNNTGNDVPRGVRNWYSNYNDKNKWEEIVSCQKENLFFDKKIRDKYLKRVIVGDMLLLVLIILISFKKNIWLAILLSLDAIIKNIQKTYRVYTLKNFYDKVYSYIAGCKNKYSERDVIKIQNYINERRKMNIDISNNIHNKFSNELHNDYKYITQKHTN